MSLLVLYSWQLVAAVFTSLALALLGIQLAARDRSTQILSSSQGAMVGALLGIGILHGREGGGDQLPLILALLGSCVAYLTSERLANKYPASRNTFILGFFAMLLALGHLVSVIFPAVETHLAQIYLGDLAVLSNANAKLICLISVFSLVFMVFFWRAISLRSFQCAVFGEKGSFKDMLVALLVISTSVEMMGVLFTLALLFLPTALFAKGVSSLKEHVFFSVLTAGLSTLIGFILSLQFTQLPTVPAIVMCVVVLGGVLRQGGVAWQQWKSV